MPANLQEVLAEVDTANMPVSNTLTLHWQVQYPAADPDHTVGTWYDLESEGPISGGVHPIRNNPTNTTVGDAVVVPQLYYPTKYRFQVDNSPTSSTVTASLFSVP